MPLNSLLPDTLLLPKQPGDIDPINTVEPCLHDAAVLTRHLQMLLRRPVNRRLQRAFVALAGGDEALGLLAFYVWRGRTRRQT